MTFLDPPSASPGQRNRACFSNYRSHSAQSHYVYNMPPAIDLPVGCWPDKAAARIKRVFLDQLGRTRKRPAKRSLARLVARLQWNISWSIADRPIPRTENRRARQSMTAFHPHDSHGALQEKPAKSSDNGCGGRPVAGLTTEPQICPGFIGVIHLNA